MCMTKARPATRGTRSASPGSGESQAVGLSMSSVFSVMQGYRDLLDRYLVALDALMDLGGTTRNDRSRLELERYRYERELATTARQGVKRILALLGREMKES